VGQEGHRTISANISNLTVGGHYSVLRFSNTMDVPRSNFLAAPFDKRFDFTASATVHMLVDFDTFMSNSSMFYRTVVSVAAATTEAATTEAPTTVAATTVATTTAATTTAAATTAAAITAAATTAAVPPPPSTTVAATTTAAPTRTAASFSDLSTQAASSGADSTATVMLTVVLAAMAALI
jgi:hypothetical protein